MTGDPLRDVAGACIYYRQHEDDRLAVRRRLLDQAVARAPAGRRHLLRAYVEIIAILTCDLYPESQKPIQATGHYQCAIAVLWDLGWKATDQIGADCAGLQHRQGSLTDVSSAELRKAWGLLRGPEAVGAPGAGTTSNPAAALGRDLTGAAPFSEDHPEKVSMVVRWFCDEDGDLEGILADDAGRLASAAG
ncbi:hypothetical protein [Streptomyces sp. CS113]|uniref:hypothetical protein n=1 Tax=Streptomyces sp. CS113 TaxID=1982761 RepID=UPI0015C58587|nr:hypothetical protein [Streptomyces sp. CS113]